MDNPVWAQVTAELEAQRRRNEQENERRRTEIAEKQPQLDQLIAQRHELIMGAVRGAFTGETPQDPEQVMREYNEKIAAGLESAGYPRDYLAPVCRCAQCGDQGYVYEGGLKKPCECLRRFYAQALARADIQTQAGQTFARFDLNRFPDAPLPGTDVTQREYMKLVRDKCQAFADGVGSGPWKTLLLHGGSGLGKTFLLNCVGQAARDRGVETLFVTAYGLLMALKNAYFSRSGETAWVYFDTPLLLIDDLGMEPLMENITVEQIYHLLSERLDHGLYTAVTTNLSRTELKERYTERITSRLLDARSGVAIPFRGQDVRLMKNEA